MNNNSKFFIYACLRTAVQSYRKKYGFTQEEMAEALHISVRSYWNQEHGEHGFSGSSVIYFLILLSPEELKEFLTALSNAISEKSEVESDE